METSGVDDPKTRWTAPGTGDWYERDRWSRASRRRRDPTLVARVLAERLEVRDALVLDAPCGTGRLHGAIATRGAYVGLEISAAMLEQARRHADARLVRGDVEHLPFRDGTFPVVVCCRLLHHLRDRASLEVALSELVRVSDAWIVGSFWDSGSLEAARHRLPFVRRPRHRVAHSRATIDAAVRSSGAIVVQWRHSLRFFSQQAWFVARKRATANA